MKMKEWDVCPECGARRIAICRFCNTIGDHFPLADLDLVLPPEHAESVAEKFSSKEDSYDDEETPSVAAQPFLADSLGSAFASKIEVKTEETSCESDVHEGTNASDASGAEKEHSCKCQNTNPAAKRHEFVTLSNPLDADPDVAEDAEEYPLAVMCPCCDELLYPQFLKKCSGCGHEFPDGVELESIEDAHFYVPEDDEDDSDEDFDEDSDEDDDEENDDDESGGTVGPKQTRKSKSSSRPDAGGCCLMFLGVLTTGTFFWFFV